MEYASTPQAVLAAIEIPRDERTPEEADRVTKHYRLIAPRLAATRERIAAVNKLLAEIKPVTVPIMRDRSPKMRRVTRVQVRGNYSNVGNEVTADVPAVFPPLVIDAPRNRLALARWLVDERNPLTARVTANHLWEQIFGIGIVATSEEFGSQGDLPSHPELLDWLATELSGGGWNMKAFIKSLVMTAVYRQSSRVTPELERRDPDNRLLARGPRVRLSAEMVRDQALAVSGLLSGKMFGPPVKPAQPASGLTAAFGGATDWQTSEGEDRYRRAVYTTIRRSSPYPSMATFDAPNREVCTLRRSRTNTPLQALVTMNDPVYVEAAQSLARRMVGQPAPPEQATSESPGQSSGQSPVGSEPADVIRRGFRLCFARDPRESELARLMALHERARSTYLANADAARRMASEPLGPPPAGADLADLAAWTVVANVLLNLDETLMKP